MLDIRNLVVPVKAVDGDAETQLYSCVLNFDVVLFSIVDLVYDL